MAENTEFRRITRYAAILNDMQMIYNATRDEVITALCAESIYFYINNS